MKANTSFVFSAQTRMWSRVASLTAREYLIADLLISFFFLVFFALHQSQLCITEGPILPSASWEWHRNHLPEGLGGPGMV